MHGSMGAQAVHSNHQQSTSVLSCPHARRQQSCGRAVGANKMSSRYDSYSPCRRTKRTLRLVSSAGTGALGARCCARARLPWPRAGAGSGGSCSYLQRAYAVFIKLDKNLVKIAGFYHRYDFLERSQQVQAIGARKIAAMSGKDSGHTPGAVVLEEQQQVLARDQEGVRGRQGAEVVIHGWQLRLRVRSQHRQLVERVAACKPQ